MLRMRCRARESTQINIRLPCQMVEILKEFARRAGIGYQVLMKRWLEAHFVKNEITYDKSRNDSARG